jgi:single-strand DNA-binding protein
MASRSVNKVILIGHLGKDAETKFTPNGTARTTFSVATSRRWKDQATGEWKDETDWHNIIMWRAENLTNYLLKGKQVYIEGRLQTRSWDDKDGKKNYMTEVVADDFNQGITDDDVPF